MANNSKEKMDKNHEQAMVRDYMEKYGRNEEETRKIMAIALKLNTSFLKVYASLPDKDLTKDSGFDWLVLEQNLEKKKKYYLKNRSYAKLTVDELQKIELEKNKENFETLSIWWIYKFFQELPKDQFISCKDAFEQLQTWIPKEHKDSQIYEGEKFKYPTIQSAMSEMLSAGILVARKPKGNERQFGRAKLYQINPYYRSEPFSLEIKNLWKKACSEMQHKFKEVSIYLKLGKIILNTCSDPTISFIQKYSIIMTLIGEVLVQAELKSQNYGELNNLIEEAKKDRALRWTILKEHRLNVKRMRELKKLGKKSRRTKKLIGPILGEKGQDYGKSKVYKKYEEDEDDDFPDTTPTNNSDFEDWKPGDGDL